MTVFGGEKKYIGQEVTIISAQKVFIETWNRTLDPLCIHQVSLTESRNPAPLFNWDRLELGVYKIVPSLGRAGFKLSFQKWFQNHSRITLTNAPTTVLGSRSSRDIALPHFLLQVSRGCFFLAKNSLGLRAVRESGSLTLYCRAVTWHVQRKRGAGCRGAHLSAVSIGLLSLTPQFSETLLNFLKATSKNSFIQVCHSPNSTEEFPCSSTHACFKLKVKFTLVTRQDIIFLVMILSLKCILLHHTIVFP